MAKTTVRRSTRSRSNGRSGDKLDTALAKLKEDPEAPSRGLLWWIFLGPGKIIAEIEYWLPGPGTVFSSARRRHSTLSHFTYTLGFYSAAAIVLFLIFSS
jgi:hypothetical protein